MRIVVHRRMVNTGKAMAASLHGLACQQESSVLTIHSKRRRYPPAQPPSVIACTGHNPCIGSNGGYGVETSRTPIVLRCIDYPCGIGPSFANGSDVRFMAWLDIRASIAHWQRALKLSARSTRISDDGLPSTVHIMC